MKQTVYTASPESQQIHVWDLDLAGKLTLVQVVDAPGQVQPMVVSPNGCRRAGRLPFGKYFPGQSHPVGAGAEAGSYLPVYPERRRFSRRAGAG